MRDGEPVSEEDLATGQRLASSRAAAGMSQRRAAEALGVAQSRIAKLETGARRLLFSEAVAFARLYGVSLDALAGSVGTDVAGSD